MIYITCPNCGHKILKAEVGSRVEACCPKCKITIKAEVKENGITILKIGTIVDKE